MALHTAPSTTAASRVRGEGPRGKARAGRGRGGSGLLRIAGLAALALLSAFSLLARYTDGAGSFLDLLYGCMSTSGLALSALSALLFFAYARMYRACAPSGRDRRSRVCADVLAALFSISMVAGRAFLVREKIGDIYDYGSFAPLACDAGHTLFSLLMCVGLFAVARMAVLFAFDVFDAARDSARLRRLRGMLKAGMGRGGKAGAGADSGGADAGADGAAGVRAGRHGAYAKVADFLSTPWHVALVLLVCWLPYIVVYFPGSVYHDGAYQVRQFFGIQDLTGHHPIATTFIFGWLLSAGKALGSDAAGVFFITCLQAAALAYACTRVVGHVCAGPARAGRVQAGGTGAAPGGLRRFAAPVLTAFFALVPLFGYAVISIKKDALFYVAFTLLVLAAIDLVVRLVADARGQAPSRPIATRGRLASLLPAGVWGSSGAACARVVLWGCLASMFRNDGFLFFVCLVVCVFIVCMLETRVRAKRARARAAKPAAASTSALETAVEPASEAAPETAPASRIPCVAAPLVCLVAVGSIYIVGYMLFAMAVTGAERGSIAEALSLPIQQVARYCIFAPDDVDDEMREGVAALLDVSSLNTENYDPRDSDNLKLYHFNNKCTADDLLAFFGAWVKGGLRHPELYAEAFVDHTSGWWYIEELAAPGETVCGMNLYQSVPRTKMYCDALSFKMPFYDTPLRTGFERLTYAVSYVPVLGLFTYPPVYFWLLALVCAWGVARRNPRAVMLAPLFVYFAVCLASPANGLVRYAVPVMMALWPAAAYVLDARVRAARVRADRL